MTEVEAQQWLVGQGHPPAAMARLAQLAGLVVEESGRQNLIARSTLDQLWSRHIADSAQLLALAGNMPGLWVDLGSGGGFPGLVIACLRSEPITLVEMRPLRARFLTACVEKLSLDHAQVAQVNAHSFEPGAPVAVLSARAFAPMERLIALAGHLAGDRTLWLLPKGRSAKSELESLPTSWQSVFHVEQSVTDPDSAIIVGRGVAVPQRRGRATAQGHKST